jgi:hypothetical protein
LLTACEQEHVEFHSKNKFEKSAHLAGFIIRKIYRGAWSHERPVMGENYKKCSSQMGSGVAIFSTFQQNELVL